MFSLLQNTASSSHVGELNDWNFNFISPPTGPSWEDLLELRI